jgi:hypothetical protein
VIDIDSRDFFLFLFSLFWFPNYFLFTQLYTLYLFLASCDLGSKMERVLFFFFTFSLGVSIQPVGVGRHALHIRGEG